MEHDRLAAVVGIHGPHVLGYQLVTLERFISLPHESFSCSGLQML